MINETKQEEFFRRRKVIKIKQNSQRVTDEAIRFLRPLKLTEVSIPRNQKIELQTVQQRKMKNHLRLLSFDEF